MNGVSRNAQVAFNLPNFSAWAGILPPKLLLAPKDHFTYVAEFLPLGISATATVQTQIEQESAFVIVGGVRVFTDTSNAAIAGDFAPALVTIRDASSGRLLMNSAVHIENLFGTAKEPIFWPYPKILKPNTILSTTLQNLEATARNYRLGYLGFKCYRSESMDEFAG